MSRSAQLPRIAESKASARRSGHAVEREIGSHFWVILSAFSTIFETGHTLREGGRLFDAVFARGRNQLTVAGRVHAVGRVGAIIPLLVEVLEISAVGQPMSPLLN